MAKKKIAKGKTAKKTMNTPAKKTAKKIMKTAAKKAVKSTAKNAVKKPGKAMLKKAIPGSAKSKQKISRSKSQKSTSPYRGLVIVNKGIEDIACLEIKELTGRKAEAKEGAAIFPISDLSELCMLSYKGQSFGRVLLLLDEFESAEQDLQRLFANIKTDFTAAEKLIKRSEIRFACRCGRIGEQGFQKSDVEKALGEKIHKTYQTVDLANPNIVFYAYVIGNRYYIGIDFSGEIDKREYRIYSTPKELKATIAYSLLRIAGYDKKKSMLDPFAGSGTIPIEAALYATNTSPRYFKKNTLPFTKFNVKFDFKKYDKITLAKGISSSDASLHNLKSAEKNSKVANVNKSVSVSRIDIEWIDTKFDEHEIDMIVTWPIESNKEQDDKEVIKLYKEFFYQIEYVVKKKCRLVLVVKKPDSIDSLKETSKEYFKLIDSRKVMQGKEELNVLVFERR